MKSEEHDLVTLVHHIELTEANWWQKGLDRLVCGVLWLKDESLTNHQIKALLLNNFNIDIELNDVNKILRKDKNGYFYKRPDGTIALKENARKNFEAEHDESEQIQKRAQEIFCNTLEKHKNRIESERAKEMWQQFLQQVLLPAVKAAGASVYELFCHKRPCQDSYTDQLDSWLTSLTAEEAMAGDAAVQDFFGSSNKKTREFLLRYLNAYFFVESHRLPSDVLDRLTGPGRANPSFKFFIDTNILISMLGLQSNPVNEAITQLVETLTQLPPHLSANLYLIQPTVDESKHVINGMLQSLKNLNKSEKLMGLLSSTSQSGLVQRLAKNGDRNNIDPAGILELYFDNLRTVAEDKGVHFFNAKLEDYPTDPRIATHIAEQLEFEQEIYSEDRRKGYKQLEHDMIVWQFISDKRSAGIESPLDATFWFVTADNRMIAFDRYQQRRSGNPVPISILPTAVLQLLRFWLPQGEALSDALVCSFRLPFIMRDFDSESEELTLRIIKRLGCLEGIDDLSSESLQRIVMNEGLRARLSGTCDEEDEIQFIEKAFVREMAKYEKKLADTQLELQESEVQRMNLIKERPQLEKGKIIAENNAHNLAKMLNKQQEEKKQKERQIDEMEAEINELKAFKEDEEGRRMKQKECARKKAEFYATCYWICTWVSLFTGLIGLFLYAPNLNSSIKINLISLYAWGLWVWLTFVFLISWVIGFLLTGIKGGEKHKFLKKAAIGSSSCLVIPLIQDLMLNLGEGQFLFSKLIVAYGF